MEVWKGTGWCVCGGGRRAAEQVSDFTEPRYEAAERCLLLKVHPREEQNPLRISPRPGHLSVKGTDEPDKSIYVQNINDCFLQTHFLKSTDENSEDAVRAVSI